MNSQHKEHVDPRCQVEIWKPQLSAAHMDSLRQRHSLFYRISDELQADMDRIAEIEQQSFPDGGAWDSFKARDYFIDNLESVIAVLRDPNTKQIVGYSVAVPAEFAYQSHRYYSDRKPGGNTAYIVKTAIDPQYRGQGYVKEIQVVLEAELLRRGFEYVERDAADVPSEKGSSYADNVLKNNQDKLISSHTHESPIGPQRFIRMALVGRN